MWKTIAKDNSLLFALPRIGLLKKENIIAGNSTVNSSKSTTIRIIIGCEMGGEYVRQ